MEYVLYLEEIADKISLTLSSFLIFLLLVPHFSSAMCRTFRPTFTLLDDTGSGDSTRAAASVSLPLHSLNRDSLHTDTNNCYNDFADESVPSPINSSMIPTPTPEPADVDSDGIRDSLEANPPVAGQTNIYLWDSDNDGFKDGYELVMGTNPDSDLDYPPLEDVDENSNVDNVDAQRTFNFYLSANPIPFVHNNSDSNRDGLIDNVDAQKLFLFYLNIITELPAD